MLTDRHVAASDDRVSQLEAQIAQRDNAIAFLRARFAAEPIRPPGSPLDGEPVCTFLSDPADTADATEPARASAMSRSSRPTIVVLPGFDWAFRFQRPQYLARKLAQRGHRVLFLTTSSYNRERPYELAEVEPGVFQTTIGARQPFDVHGTFDPDAVEDIVAAFDVLRRDLGISQAHIVANYPTWQTVATRLRARFDWHLIYDCIDEWEHTPGLAPSIRRQEEAMVRAADLTIFSADRLAEKWQGEARQSLVVRNGVDCELYRACAPNDLLTDLTHPVIGYFGTLAARIDVPLLVAIARHRRDATLVIAGGRWDIGLDDLEPLLAQPNVRYLGERPHAEMPLLLWHFDVCLLPFYVGPATEAGNPVKLYEYLAGGKPIVATRLPEIAPFEDRCYLSSSRAEFIAQVDAALAEDDPELAGRRRAAAAANDWSTRSEDVADALDRLAESPPRSSTRDAVMPVEASEAWARAVSDVAMSVIERDQQIRELQAECDERLVWATTLEREIAERESLIRELQQTVAQQDGSIRALLGEQAAWTDRLDAEIAAREGHIQLLKDTVTDQTEQIHGLEAKLKKLARRIEHLRPSSLPGRMRRAAQLLLGRS